MGQEENPLSPSSGCAHSAPSYNTAGEGSTDSTLQQELPVISSSHFCDEARISGETSAVIQYQEGSRSQPDTYKECSIHRKEECVSFNEKLGIAGRGGFMLDLAAGKLPRLEMGWFWLQIQSLAPRAGVTGTHTQAGNCVSCGPQWKHRLSFIGLWDHLAVVSAQGCQTRE